jgi:flotillin
MSIMIIVAVGIVLTLLTVVGILSRFRKCKSDQILVVYGKTGGNKSAKCIQGGAAFVWPVIQGYEYMSLTPLQFECNLKKALSSQTIRVDVPTTVTVAISTEPEIMQNAAERLLAISDSEIENLVKDIVYGQMRTIVADMTIEELNADRDKFLSKTKSMVETEIKKLGLTLINFNITDINDDAGYIVALGQKAKAIAINQANVETAKADQEGAVLTAEQVKIQNSTVANTKKQEAVAIAEVERDKQASLAEADKEKMSKVAAAQSERDSNIALAQRNRDISVAKSQSEGKIGQIEADKKVATANGELAVVEAEANSKAESAREVALAEIEKNKELANKSAEDAKALREEAKLKASTIVPAEIAKQKMLIDAQGYQSKLETEATANANKSKIEATGVAEATLQKGKAEADVIALKGLAEATAKEKSLLAEANGFKAMIEAAESNPAVAIQYKMVSEWEKISTAQVEAFKHMELGNITVMDTSNGKGLTEFMQGLMSTVAPALNVMKSMDIPGVSKALQGEEKKEVVDSGFEDVTKTDKKKKK